MTLNSHVKQIDAADIEVPMVPGNRGDRNQMASLDRKAMMIVEDFNDTAGGNTFDSLQASP